MRFSCEDEDASEFANCLLHFVQKCCVFAIYSFCAALDTIDNFRSHQTWNTLHKSTCTDLHIREFAFGKHPEICIRTNRTSRNLCSKINCLCSKINCLCSMINCLCSKINCLCSKINCLCSKINCLCSKINCLCLHLWATVNALPLRHFNFFPSSFS